MKFKIGDKIKFRNNKTGTISHMLEVPKRVAGSDDYFYRVIHDDNISSIENEKSIQLDIARMRAEKLEQLL